MFTIAHLTDTHFGATEHAAARVRGVLAHLDAMDPRPDVLLVTGDIADHGTAREYAEAREVLGAWSGPIGLVIGNHDVRDAFVEGLGDRLLGGGTTQALEVEGHRFLLLDSLVDAVDGERQDHGVLSEESLTWLADELARDHRPTFVCLHHPPVDLGIELMDPIRLRDPERLEAVLSPHDQVRAVLVGHAHSMGATTFAGRPLLIGGGVVSTVMLDREPRPRLWLGAPPAFALHLVHDDGRLVTLWRALPGTTA